jgi:hypothetical protein
MADSQRLQALAALQSALDAVSSLATVEHGYEEQELSTYDDTDTPIIFIIPTTENYVWEKSMHHLCSLTVVCPMYFLDDGTDAQQGEALIQAVRNKIGEDITLGGKVAEARVMSISFAGTFPLWKVVFTMRLRYEKRIDNV